MKTLIGQRVLLFWFQLTVSSSLQPILPSRKSLESADASLILESSCAGDKSLVITVHNKHNVLLPDTFVARVTVPISKIEAGGSVQHYPLHNKKDEQIADISLEMNITDGTVAPPRCPDMYYLHSAVCMLDLLEVCHLGRFSSLANMKSGFCPGPVAFGIHCYSQRAFSYFDYVLPRRVAFESFSTLVTAWYDLNAH